MYDPCAAHIPAISSTPAARFPPKSPDSPPLPKVQSSSSASLQAKSISISRRDVAVLFTSILILPPPPASAFSFGFSGPKDWLREQKKKSAKFLLAPVDASRNSLREAYLLLTKSGTVYGQRDLEEVQKLLISAARDCVPQERNSFVDFQASTGVEVCTFRLIMKNAASLLDDKDPIKLEAESKLADLIRSFAYVNDMTRETDIQVVSDRQRVADALMDTISSLNDFEKGIKDCLEI